MQRLKSWAFRNPVANRSQSPCGRAVALRSAGRGHGAQRPVHALGSEGTAHGALRAVPMLAICAMRVSQENRNRIDKRKPPHIVEARWRTSIITALAGALRLVEHQR